VCLEQNYGQNYGQNFESGWEALADLCNKRKRM
jgi:hypothetical protein